MPPGSRDEALATLRRHLQRLEQQRPEVPRTVLPLGIPAIDRALPWDGLPCGALHEISGRAGDGASFGFAAMLLGRLLRRTDGTALWCRLSGAAQETGRPYGPGMTRFGLPVERLLQVEVKRPAELLWALEEGLRCHGLAAVVGEAAVPDLTASRRLQLAAESGGGMALVLPPPDPAPPASAAFTRWRVAALPARPDRPGYPPLPRWRVDLWRCRGGAPGAWDMEWDDEAFRSTVAAALADRPLAAAG